MNRYDIATAAQTRQILGDEALHDVCQALAYQDCDGETQTVMHATSDPMHTNPWQHQCYFVRHKDDAGAASWIGFAETSTTESTYHYYCDKSKEFDTTQCALVTLCNRFYIRAEHRRRGAGTALLHTLIRDANTQGSLLVVRGNESLMQLALRLTCGFCRAPRVGTGEWGECFRGTCSTYQVVYLPPQRRHHRGRRIHLPDEVRERWLIP